MGDPPISSNDTPIYWEIYQLHQDFLGKLAWPCWKSTKLWRHKMQFGDCRKHFLDFGDHHLEVVPQYMDVLFEVTLATCWGSNFFLFVLDLYLPRDFVVCRQRQWFKFRFPPHHLWPLDSATFSCAHLNLISWEKIRPIWGLLGRSGIPTKSPWLVKNTKSWSNHWRIYIDLWHGYQSKWLCLKIGCPRGPRSKSIGSWMVMMFAIHLAI